LAWNIQVTSSFTYQSTDEEDTRSDLDWGIEDLGKRYQIWTCNLDFLQILFQRDVQRIGPVPLAWANVFGYDISKPLSILCWDDNRSEDEGEGLLNEGGFEGFDGE